MSDIFIEIDTITEMSVQQTIENSTAVAANIISSIEDLSDDLT